MKGKISFLFFALCLCGMRTNAQTTVVDSFMSGGLMRNFMVYVPASYDPTEPTPLVFNLHGFTSNNVQQAFYANFNPIADTANFIVVLPNGTFDGNGDRFWNTFGGSSLVDDIGFISDLIDSTSVHYNIDQDRIYSTGMSNGGFMSYDLACYLSNRIAAIASVTGTMIWSHGNNCNPSHPVPVMEIHGTADGVVPYGGGGSFMPIDTLVRLWAAKSNCNPTPVITAVPNTSLLDGCTADHFLYSGGDNGSTVEHYRVNGGGHTWPGAPIVIGVTNMDFNACREIWRFFSQYTINGIVTENAKPSEPETGVDIFPNPSEGSITIQLPEGKGKNIVVLNSLGQIAQEMNTSDVTAQLNFKQNGIYFIHIQFGHQYYFEKIVVNRADF
jgi:polyhydroxybutyrate depolymerase